MLAHSRFQWLQEIAIAISLMTAFSVIFLVGFIIHASVTELLSNMDEYRFTLNNMLSDVMDILKRGGVASEAKVMERFDELPLGTFIANTLNSIIFEILSILETTFFVFVFAIYIQLGRKPGTGLRKGGVGRLEQRIQPVPGARALVNTLRSKGCRTVLVTGGFHHFADPVAEQLGFERVVGNRLGVAGGALTGLLAGPVSDASTKLATLEDERAQLGEGARVLATGDGANDIPMIEAADYGIAYRAKPKAREAANGRIASVELTAILKLLGIAESEWVEDFDPA